MRTAAAYIGTGPTGKAGDMGSRLMLTTELPRSPRAGRAARRALALVARRLDPGRIQDARLLVTELATNAVRHGQGPIVLSVELDGERARFAVRDDGSGRPRMRDEPGADGGWGLRIVDRIADRWGVEPSGPEVWFELAA